MVVTPFGRVHACALRIRRGGREDEHVRGAYRSSLAGAASIAVPCGSVKGCGGFEYERTFGDLFAVKCAEGAGRSLVRIALQWGRWAHDSVAHAFRSSR